MIMTRDENSYSSYNQFNSRPNSNNNNHNPKSNDNFSYKSIEDEMLRVVHKSNQLFTLEDIDDGRSYQWYNDYAQNSKMYKSFKQERLSRSLPDTNQIFCNNKTHSVGGSSATKETDIFTEFCESTSLHGWSFYGGSKSDGKFAASSIFWLLVIVMSVSSAIYVMTTNIQEFREATVSYNLQSPTVSLEEVFFPSVVVCNMNTLRSSFIYLLLQDTKIKERNVTYYELKKIVHLMFIDGDDYKLSEREKIIVDTMFESETYLAMFKELYDGAVESGPFDRDWSNVPVVKDHALKDVKMKNDKERAKYERAYVPELASQFREGELILRLDMKGIAINYQSGFTTDIAESCIWLTPFIKKPGDFWDLRTMIPFSKNSWPNGLEFLFDAESFDYGLSSSGSEGLVLSIIYHLDIPIMKNIGINIQPGQNVQIAITPTLLNTTYGARRRFTPVRRQCYFEDEISLKHFPPKNSYRYEMSNCLLEATLQKIESDCKCTPKFFMTTVTGFEPCEGQQKKCMNVHMADMGEQRSITDQGISKPCLAACEDQVHKFLVTHASYPNEDAFVGTLAFCLLLQKLIKSCNGDRKESLSKKFPNLCPAIENEKTIIGTINCEQSYEDPAKGTQLTAKDLSKSLQSEIYRYAKSNLAKVNIYIKDPYVAKYVTEEKITEIAFVGTVGGILGLFLGFSFISAMEIVYIFCIKIILRKIGKKEKTQRKHITQIEPIN